MKVIHSRDVVFDEASMPGMEKETTPRYVELKIEEEPVVKETVTPNPPDDVTEDIPVDEQLKNQRHPIRLSRNQFYAHQHETSKNPTGMATTLLWLQPSSKIPPQ